MLMEVSQLFSEFEFVAVVVFCSGIVTTAVLLPPTATKTTTALTLTIWFHFKT